MTFEEIEVETLDGIQKHIVIKYENGTMKGFPADESNPEFVAFQKALEAEA